MAGVEGDNAARLRQDLGAADDELEAVTALLQRDRERWLAQHWHVVVLDEATAEAGSAGAHDDDGVARGLGCVLVGMAAVVEAQALVVDHVLSPCRFFCLAPSLCGEGGEGPYWFSSAFHISMSRSAVQMRGLSIPFASS